MKEISFGQHYFGIAMLLPSSLLINGILFNTEALMNNNKKQMNILESCDKDLFMRLFSSPRTTPSEAFYLETSTIPIRFIVMGRRLMFYWNILQKPDVELVRQVFNGMKEFPTENDWYGEVKEDLVFCDIPFTEEEISHMSKLSFKKVVKDSIKRKTSEYLEDKIRQHSKTKDMEIKNNMCDYLQTNELSTDDKRLLFKLRCRMTNNKSNFKNLHTNKLECRLCEDANSQETLTHLTKCPFLVTKVEGISDLHQDDIFGELSAQVKAVKVWREVFACLDEVDTAKCTDDE